jgi:glycosyltransferase involved in cell wall biosynthesis
VSCPNVSFVVIAYNEDHHIGQTLSSIEALDGLGDHEVIVIDDGSTDRTAEVVAEFARSHPAVRLVSQTNQGRGAARARGLAEAREDLVAMVDADIELSTDWLERCLDALRGDVSAVGGVPMPDGDSTWLHRACKLAPRLVGRQQITGSNCLCRREVLTAIGFDPTMRTAEDVVFNHKFHTAGFTSRCLADLTCSHLEDKGYLRTLTWMLESGISATHQLFRFRPLRGPDVAVAGWVVVGVGAGAAFGWTWGLGAAATWLLAVAFAHVCRSFRVCWSPIYLLRFATACVLNTTIIGCYFLGRFVGLVTANGIPRL